MEIVSMCGCPSSVSAVSDVVRIIPCKRWLSTVSERSAKVRPIKCGPAGMRTRVRRLASSGSPKAVGFCSMSLY